MKVCNIGSFLEKLHNAAFKGENHEKKEPRRRAKARKEGIKECFMHPLRALFALSWQDAFIYPQRTRKMPYGVIFRVRSCGSRGQ
jgi:hypothetical protein